MKKCPYCGQEYSDDNCVCVIDNNPLESTDPKPLIPDCASESVNATAPRSTEDDADTNKPDGFESLGRFDPFEAARLLKKFTEAGVRFEIDNIEKRVFTSGGEFSGAGYVTRNWVEIFVATDDEEKATKILTADWKA